jgi:hypothetical protein
MAHIKATFAMTIQDVFSRFISTAPSGTKKQEFHCKQFPPASLTYPPSEHSPPSLELRKRFLWLWLNPTWLLSQSRYSADMMIELSVVNVLFVSDSCVRHFSIPTGIAGSEGL